MPQKKTYTFEEAVASSEEYFKGDSLAANVWANKYALKDSQGALYELNPNDMHKRLAKEIHRIEKRYPNPLSEQEIFEVLKDFKYIVPQGGPMSGIGNDKQIASLSNCFVIGNDGMSDSYGGIMKIDQEQVQLMKRRGGVGHDLSHIRPKGTDVKNSALTSTGIYPFMERYSNSTREVAQDGRRGALMLSVSIKHPDAIDFIEAKMTPGKVTGANVSVRIDDDFMKAVVNDGEYTQQYPIDSDNPTHVQTIKAKTLWDKIVHNAWKSAEPGILFWDTIIKESVPDNYADLGYKTVSTNPCGEIPLCPYDSCRLLAINLYSYVTNPFQADASFDFELFEKHVRIAQRIMDDIIDLELEKIEGILAKIESDPENEEVKKVEVDLWKNIYKKAKEGRRTGVGITAEGDMLAALGLRYGDEMAINFSVGIHQKVAINAYKSSIEMAKDRGAFTIFDFEREKDNPFVNRIANMEPSIMEDMKKYGRRNIACLTIAPTGTTSIMTQTTSGLEPVFLPYYMRRRKVNPNDKDVRVDFTDEVGDAFEEHVVMHHKFVDWMKVKGYDTEKKYNDKEMQEIVKKSPYFKATSNDIDWVKKVEMQGAIQKWVDHSISVTVNLPQETPKNLIAEVYKTAWEHGCKGITVYRDGSRSGILVNNNTKKDENKTLVFPKERPRKIEADIVRFQNNKEKWIACVGVLEGKPYEIFTGLSDEEEGMMVPRSIKKGEIVKNVDDGKSRYDFQFTSARGYKTTIEGLSHKFNEEYWNYAKLISGVLRFGMPIERVIELISSLRLDNEALNTWMAGVERALKRYIPNGATAEGQNCSNCGSSNLIYQEGCLSCQDCGSSKCG